MGRDDASQLILLRFSGDITIKARGTRFQFVRRLLSNLRDALASEGVAPRIQLSHNRMFVEVADAAVMPALARVFGVQSLSLVERRVPTQLAAIVAAGVECFRERVAGKRFAVRARRVGDRAQIGVSAHAVEVELGAALLPFAAGVDLEQPELTVGVELLERESYLFCERVPALGGLPLGVEGRAVALFSGGFDSAVAAWYLLKRGVALDYVFCNLGGETHLQGVLRVARILACRWSYGDRPAFHVVDFSPVVADLQARTAKRFWQVLLKRLLLRAAERIALDRPRRRDRDGRCRGAGLVADAPESRGDLARDARSRSCGRSSASTRTRSSPSRRRSAPSSSRRWSANTAIWWRGGRRRAPRWPPSKPRRPASTRRCSSARWRSARSTTCARLEESQLGFPELEIERIPPDAIVIDLSPRDRYQSWHWEGALRLDFQQALQAYAVLRSDTPLCDLLRVRLAERVPRRADAQGRTAAPSTCAAGAARSSAR